MLKSSMKRQIFIATTIALLRPNFYSCVQLTVEYDLPREIEYLRRHDQATRRIMDAVEMPDRLAENLVMFVRK